MLKVMKASAGSGKTFNLAKTYIELLFKARDRYAYRHILAVTFTNKATDEMKNRILKELYVLAVYPEQSGYFNIFVPETFASADELQKTAGNILYSILHDYSAFSVSTIDKFFQQTLKAFSREIGQYASYQVELDRKALVAESVDRILDSLTEGDSGLLEWLTDNVIEQIENSGNYDLETAITNMAQRIMSNEHRDKIEKYGIDESSVYSKETLLSIRRLCRKEIRTFVSKVSESASTVISLMQQAGVNPSSTYRKCFEKLYGYVGLKPSDTIAMPSDTFLKVAGNPENWFNKKDTPKYLPLVSPLIEAPLNDFCNCFGKEYAVYSTAMIIDRQLYELGVAAELDRTFKELAKEKNVLCIEDSNVLLKNIIDGSDAPFIYEKSGVRFEHFLLDEFQDTSRIQWENFKPLLLNSDAAGNENLIVGDIKQSIYRWRGSDWKLLDEREFEKDFNDVRPETLDTNYRSLKNIVEFNNGFFEYAAGELDAMLGNPDDTISFLYRDVKQNVVSKSPEEGSVELTFCNKDEEPRKVLDSIYEVCSNGAHFGDIAVIIRDKNSGNTIASFLIDNGIPVITDDSLKIRASVTVRRIVSLLHFADNPSDTAGSFIARSLDIPLPENYRSLMDLTEALLRPLREYDCEVFDNETLYIHSFMDILQEYVSVNGNSLRGFLKSWEEQDPSISSPVSGNSVRIITVHKSKGLDFPYVIMPYAEKVNLFKPSEYWCCPDTEGTSLEALPKAVFDVELSKNSSNTLFADDYREEVVLQYIDNINVLYVALTRASKGMHIIASLPPKTFFSAIDKGLKPCFNKFSDMLFWYASESGASAGFHRAGDEEGTVTFRLGTVYDFSKKENPGTVKTSLFAPAEEKHVGYPSWPLNYESDDSESDVCYRGRLKFSPDAVDFFSEAGEAGVTASHRIRGIVLHDILSRIFVMSDIGPAVSGALMSGVLNEKEAESASALLTERIASAAGRGWFPEDRNAVRNETALFDTDGNILRPDRVVETADGAVIIIDYKFGEHRKIYERQISLYADIYSRMGYASVSAFLWYVDTDRVVKVSA